MTTIPKFDLSGMTLKTDDELNEALKTASSSQDRFFKPGKHELTIQASTIVGTSGSDPDWLKVRVEMEGVGGKTIKDTLLIPTKDLAAYKTREGKTSTKPGAKLVEFLKAVGADTSIGKLGQTLTTYFSKNNSLVGLNVAGEMNYRGNYVKYMGKDDQDQRVLAIVNRDGEHLQGTPTFQEYDDANKFAEENKIPVRNFVDIVRYVASSTPNKVVNASW